MPKMRFTTVLLPFVPVDTVSKRKKLKRQRRKKTSMRIDKDAAFYIISTCRIKSKTNKRVPGRKCTLLHWNKYIKSATVPLPKKMKETPPRTDTWRLHLMRLCHRRARVSRGNNRTSSLLDARAHVPARFTINYYSTIVLFDWNWKLRAADVLKSTRDRRTTQTWTFSTRYTQPDSPDARKFHKKAESSKNKCEKKNTKRHKWTAHLMRSIKLNSDKFVAIKSEKSSEKIAQRQQI